jgi:hypothetical protein
VFYFLGYDAVYSVTVFEYICVCGGGYLFTHARPPELTSDINIFIH